MSQKRLWLGLIVAGLAGASAIVIGVVPGVRSTLHNAMPWLGIDGAPRSVAPKGSIASDSQQTLPEAVNSNSQPNTGEDSTLSMEPSQFGPLVNLEGNPPDSTKTPPYDVQFAQATVPVQNSQPSSVLPPNQATQPNNRINAPQSGLPVPVSQGSEVLVVNTAQVYFIKDIQIAAQSDGLITMLTVDDGSNVKQGEIIVEMDSRLAIKESEVAEKELHAAELKAGDDSNVKYSRAALLVAEKDVEISDSLVSQGAENVMDNEKKRLERTKARYQVNVSEIEKKRDSAAVDVQKAKRDAADVQIELKKIPAHWDGVVSEVNKHQHDFVRAGEVILRFTSMEMVRIKGHAVVSDSPHLLLNAPARVHIHVSAKQTETIEGTVSYVANRTNGIDQYPIHIDIKNKITPDGQYLFRQGMRATVEIYPRKD